MKYRGNCVFIYSSIMIKTAAADAEVETMSVHRSKDCGKTWEGPFEVTSATNPSGILDGDVPADAADKEFMDVDPDTGRVILSWSNFTPEAVGGVEIRTTYSDNLKNAATPTWSPSVIVAATDAATGMPTSPGGASRSPGRSSATATASALHARRTTASPGRRPSIPRPSSSPWTRCSATTA